MTKKFKLTVELVPKSCFYSNVRSEVPKSTWDKLRKKCYADAGHKCEICGGKGRRHPVECHEVWKYIEPENIQRLERMIALCPSCHEVKHIGRAELLGNLDRAVRHFCKVNGCSTDEAYEYLKEVFQIWHDRSQKQWDLDISYLDNFMSG